MHSVATSQPGRRREEQFFQSKNTTATTHHPYYGVWRFFVENNRKRNEVQRRIAAGEHAVIFAIGNAGIPEKSPNSEAKHEKRMKINGEKGAWAKCVD